MSRLARVVALGVPHHITQRGNGRQYILTTDSERLVYVDLLQRNAQLNGLEILGYCLMSNHLHLVAVPHQQDALSAALKHTHGRYAAYWNATHGSCGHVWQGRFYSCPLGPTHLWTALRYTELNPVRAGMVQQPQEWVWSSAATHCGERVAEPWLSINRWESYWKPETWRQYLATKETPEELIQIQRATHTGRPMGNSEFVREIERRTQRRLFPARGGRPRKSEAETAVELKTQATLEIW